MFTGMSLTGIVSHGVRRAVLLLALAGLAAALPVGLRFGPDGPGLAAAVALAESGKGKDGDGRDDDDRDDDDDDDDDHRDDDRDDDDDGDDRDDDDGVDRDDRDRGSDGGGSRGWGADKVTRAEVTATGIVVTYRDGSREILANGTYQRIDATGKILEQRPATGADLVRLRAHAGGRVTPGVSAGAPSAPPGQPAKIHIRGRDVTVTYTNGWTEAVERGRYRLTDRYGHVAVKRAATASDRNRLMGLAGR